MNEESTNSTKYVYDFIPYKAIGPFSLEKNNRNEFKNEGVKYLYENGFNHVLCRPIGIGDSNAPLNRQNKDQLIIVIDGFNVNINCHYFEVLRNFEQLSDSFVEIDDFDFDYPTKLAYSEKLGVIIFSQKYGDEYIVQNIRFLGRNEFMSVLSEIEKKESNPVFTITSRLSTFLRPDDNAECTQIIEIMENGVITFNSYNFNGQVIRNKEITLVDDNPFVIASEIKNILDKINPYAVSKDGSNWKITINLDNKVYDYYGDCTSDRQENITISAYLRKVIKLEDLFLLDANR